LLQEAQIAAHETRTSPHFISAGVFRRPTADPSTEQPNSRPKQLDKDTAKQNATRSLGKWNEFTLSIGTDKSRVSSSTHRLHPRIGFVAELFWRRM
jgi:hypothetical protein